MKLKGTGKFGFKKGIEKEVPDHTAKILIAKGAATQVGIATKETEQEEQKEPKPKAKQRSKK